MKAQRKNKESCEKSLIRVCVLNTVVAGETNTISESVWEGFCSLWVTTNTAAIEVQTKEYIYNYDQRNTTATSQTFHRKCFLWLCSPVVEEAGCVKGS